MSRETAFTLFLTGLFSMIGSFVLMGMIGKIGIGFEVVLLCGGLGLFAGGLNGIGASRPQAERATARPDNG